jgi:hypothetical protein
MDVKRRVASEIRNHTDDRRAALPELRYADVFEKRGVSRIILPMRSVPRLLEIHHKTPWVFELQNLERRGA